jgi:hypothetical protein
MNPNGQPGQQNPQVAALLARLQQMKQQGGMPAGMPPQGAPQPGMGGPQAGGQNPYLAFLAKMGQGGQGGMPAGMPPQGAPQGQPGIGGPQAPVTPQMPQGVPVGQPGVAQPGMGEPSTGHTKQLLGAMSQLHQAMTTMVDPAEQKLMRTIIILLTRLIENDQKRGGESMQNQLVGQPSAGGR